MKRIDRSRYLELFADGAVLERDGHGEKLLALPDGTMVKIFRRKRWLSTALFYPYSQRFASNARRLAKRNVLTVKVLETAYCPAVKRHLVTYQPLPGKTLRQALGAVETDRSILLTEFARFVASLHQKGVYFRSLHFGNVIVPNDGQELGLIDIADMSFQRGALPVRLRTRNFKHMLRYNEDIGYLNEFGSRRFLDQYLAAASLSVYEKLNFLSLLVQRQ